MVTKTVEGNKFVTFLLQIISTAMIDSLQVAQARSYLSSAAAYLSILVLVSLLWRWQGI